MEAKCILSTSPAPVPHQPFVVCSSFSPIPAKLVGQIVARKFVEPNELLSSNIVLKEPELQLLFDGRLELTSNPKKAKQRVEDIATWMEAFSIYSFVGKTYVSISCCYFVHTSNSSTEFGWLMIGLSASMPRRPI